MDEELRLLPNAALPDGAPTPELTDTQHLDIYGLGALRAAVVIETKNDKHVVKSVWMSSQDPSLARQLVSVIKDRYLSPDKGLLFHASASQPALREELKGSTIRSQIMSKTVDADVKLPDNISYRDMTADEARDYFQDFEEMFVKLMLTYKTAVENDEDVKQRGHAMVRSIAPNGVETPGHRFIIVEEAGVTLATLWVGERGEKQSFCYNIEVLPEKRRQGYGRKTLLVWEHAAASMRASTLGLTVFGTNEAGLRLYNGGGFEADDTTFTFSWAE
ncbi:uncharacterized protein JN550_008456 [Neoarthrinium moseri]|uniref:uncharacterized protein n=1 Tax=Neoarthrinium moseri TaxID=1658444 RepID=UPI001FDD3AD4|nr:uncharacterized protein JN550_008456 [Neoarthrinium moseri]KAI1865408.1 hypothetical protein JN550_008456 [Neoarthrinium moseri]